MSIMLPLLHRQVPVAAIGSNFSWNDNERSSTIHEKETLRESAAISAEHLHADSESQLSKLCEADDAAKSGCADRPPWWPGQLLL
jgi:hypothetical protein